MKKPAKFAPNLQLKRARELQGWSQEHVAREVGTDAFTVSRWERGVTVPSPHFKQKLSALFHLSATELGLIPAEADEAPAQASVVPVPPSTAAAPIFDPAIPPPLIREHSLVGRDDLLRDLKQRLLNSGRVALSALNGMPGVGKTALATALAHDEEVREHFSDGVLWAGLGYKPDVLGLLSRWGTVLGSALPDLALRNRPDIWAANIHAAIGQRHMLLVIDDAWELAEALAFQVGGPHCTHLITTRFPEIARRFAVDSAIVVRELEDTDGRLLLMRLAPEVVQAEPEEAQALVTAVGGLPLALTLLGNFLRAQAHSGQPRRLRSALERLRRADERLHLAEPQALIGSHPSLSAGVPLSLQAVIGISDQQMNLEAQATLRALAVFPPKPNTFSEQAAVAVSAMPVETLDLLSDAGLLESSGPERYTLHQTIADYASAHLTDTAIPQRLVSYFVAYVEEHATDYSTLDRESNNILAALEAAFEQGMQPELIRGVHAFAPWLETRGLYTMAELHLQRAQAAAHDLNDTAGQATAWLHLGRIMEQRGDVKAAYENWQKGLALARQSGHTGLIAETLMELGVQARQQGQPEQAHQCFEEALTISRRSGDRRDEGRILRNMGILAREQGQPLLARQLYEEALAAFQQIGDRREAARVLNNLGVLARQQGQPQQARQFLEEALTAFRQLDDRRGAATTLGNLSRIAENQGQLELARQLYEEALATFRQLGDRRSVAQVLHNLGTIAWEQGQPEQARYLYEEALRLLREVKDRRTIALTLSELGTLSREQRQPEQAHQFLEEAQATFEQLADRREAALALRERGLLARQQGQSEQAHQLVEQALATLRELGDRREVARTFQKLGILLRQQGHLSEAHQLLMEAIHMLREVEDRRNVARTLKELGLLLHQQGHLQEALELLLQAAVGLTLENALDTHDLNTTIGYVRTSIGEDAFLPTVKRIARETPERAYGLTQAEWAAAVLKLTT